MGYSRPAHRTGLPVMLATKEMARKALAAKLNIDQRLLRRSHRTTAGHCGGSITIVKPLGSWDNPRQGHPCNSPWSTTSQQPTQRKNRRAREGFVGNADKSRPESLSVGSIACAERASFSHAMIYRGKTAGRRKWRCLRPSNGRVRLQF